MKIQVEACKDTSNYLPLVQSTLVTCITNMDITNLCYNKAMGTVKAPVFGTLNSAISNFQTRFVRTVMEVLKYCWM